MMQWRNVVDASCCGFFNAAEMKTLYCKSPLNFSRSSLVKQANMGFGEHFCQEKLEIWRDGDESLPSGKHRTSAQNELREKKKKNQVNLSLILTLSTRSTGFTSAACFSRGKSLPMLRFSEYRIIVVFISVQWRHVKIWALCASK